MAPPPVDHRDVYDSVEKAPWTDPEQDCDYADDNLFLKGSQSETIK